MNVIINIFPKKDVLNPEAEAVKKSLSNLGFDNIDKLSLGKQITMKINEKNKKIVQKLAYDMCEKLLVNSVIEDYKITILREN
tara:strand:+ start:828 stop:1076 length:249 start_codon:yes stop_codon:yes gene_type:complete